MEVKSGRVRSAVRSAGRSDGLGQAPAVLGQLASQSAQANSKDVGVEIRVPRGPRLCCSPRGEARPRDDRCC